MKRRFTSNRYQPGLFMKKLDMHHEEHGESRRVKFDDWSNRVIGCALEGHRNIDKFQRHAPETWNQKSGIVTPSWWKSRKCTKNLPK